MVKQALYELGTVAMVIVAVSVLWIVRTYGPLYSSKAQTMEAAIVVSEETVDESVEESTPAEVNHVQNDSDWFFLRDSDVQLVKRTETVGLIQYEVTYKGNALYEDLLECEAQLSSRHEGSMIRILVQSKDNSELITHICENGKVIAIE